VSFASHGTLAVELEGGFAGRKTVVAGEDEGEGLAVAADPFGGEGGGLSGADVPVVGEMGGRPGIPGFRRIVDSEAAGEAGVGGFLALRAVAGLLYVCTGSCGEMPSATSIPVMWPRPLIGWSFLVLVLNKIDPLRGRINLKARFVRFEVDS